MTKLLDSSFNAEKGAVSVKIDQSVKDDFYIEIFSGFHSIDTYYPAQIEKVVEIDEETYRSGGKAALGAVVGGVLTGGIGLLAGAAVGGRRRSEATYLIAFKDGNHLVVEENKRFIIKKFKTMIARQEAMDIAQGRD